MGDTRFVAIVRFLNLKERLRILIDRVHIRSFGAQNHMIVVAALSHGDASLLKDYLLPHFL